VGLMRVGRPTLCQARDAVDTKWSVVNREHGARRRSQRSRPPAFPTLSADCQV
jgi:hypothetical protein